MSTSDTTQPSKETYAWLLSELQKIDKCLDENIERTESLILKQRENSKAIKKLTRSYDERDKLIGKLETRVSEARLDVAQMADAQKRQTDTCSMQ